MPDGRPARIFRPMPHGDADDFALPGHGAGRQHRHRLQPRLAKLASPGDSCRMSFSGTQARYDRLLTEQAAWRLLRADNAPMVLAFLAEAFVDESEVPYTQARTVLDAELVSARAHGRWDAETSAGVYLNAWIRAGWLREMDDSLTRTDAAEVALRFCRALDERTSGTTASHLRIVQDAVRDLAVSINPDPTERVDMLEGRKLEIEREIADLNAGIVKELGEAEQRERIREIYQLASVLTGDFRRVEDEIRTLDKDLRVQIIAGGQTRGEVLDSVMEREALLAGTDAGGAFDSFFQLLCDTNRSTEFREQLRSIMDAPVARQLSPRQRRFLDHLVRELGHESERVLRVRRRTEEGLRAYIESGAALENRAVERLVIALEQKAIELSEMALPLKSRTSLSLPTGVVRVSSPASMKLRHPDHALDTREVEERPASRTLDEGILAALDTVQVRELAERIRGVLDAEGPLTIGGVVAHTPVRAGLEELVGFLRIAHSVGAAGLDRRESVSFSERDGTRISATIPAVLLSTELFPESLDELVV